MNNIVEMLESADVGSREIDEKIAKLVGWVRTTADGKHLRGYAYCPNYTTSMDTALTLVPDGGDWQMPLPFHEYNNKLFRCEIYGKGYVYVYGVAPTPALAICIAVMKAIEETK